MKHTKTVLAALLALSMTAGMTACGSNDSNSTAESSAAASSAADEKITGETKESGDWSVMVPEGWKFKIGNAVSEGDTSIFAVEKSSFSGFTFNTYTAEKDMMSPYDYNKKTYTSEQKDLATTKYGDYEWIGFEYGGDLNKGFEAYSTSNGKFIRVSSTGFAFDSPTAKAVLESLKSK
jgi:hypothetical protein